MIYFRMMASGWLPALVFALTLTLAFAGCAVPGGRSMIPETGAVEPTGSTLQEAPWPVLADGLRDAVALDAVPGQNRIFIVEQGRHRLLVLDGTGARIDSVGVRGRSDYRFDSPVDVDATNGLHIFVSDRNNARIQRFDRRLSYLSTISPAVQSGGAGFFRPGAVAVNSFGEIFTAATESGELLKFDQNGRMQQRTDLRDTEMELPLKGLVVKDDLLFALESGRGLVHELGSQGSWRRFIAGTAGTLAIAADRDGFWVISAGELAMFSWQGRQLQRFSHGISDPATGVSAGRDALYVLTATTLYRIPHSAFTQD